MASQPGTYGLVPQKVDLTPRRHHGYAVLLFIMGTLFPPLGELSVAQSSRVLIIFISKLWQQDLVSQKISGSILY